MGLSLEQWEYLKELNDYVWMTYSYYGIPIQIVMIIYKILYPVYWQGVKRMEQFPSLLQDKLIRPFIFYGPIYYLFDIIVKVGSGKAFESACSMSFFSHHVITLLFLPFAVYSKHVPWFIISTGLFHAILLCFKRSYLQYIYLVAVLLYHYGILQPPFDNMIQGLFLEIFINKWQIQVKIKYFNEHAVIQIIKYRNNLAISNNYSVVVEWLFSLKIDYQCIIKYE